MKKKWNDRYSDNTFRPRVNPWVERFYELAKPGRALDIACGVGQNSLFLAKEGFLVDAVDISDVALSQIEDKNITKYCVDVERFLFLKERYELIICTNFLQRALFPKIIHSLKPEGVVIYETFTYKKEGFNPKFLLQKNELLKAFDELEVIYYEAGEKALMTAKKV